jgi:two-component SAPR family response regulator
LDDRVDVDVHRFEQAFAAVDGGRGESLRPECARTLTETVHLYRGDLLEGWGVEWCRYDRERFRRMYETIVDRLTDHYESRHEYGAAIAYATLSLRSDPARERSHRSLMRALAKSGDRCGALRQYLRCVEALREELEVDPEPETVVLEQMIRASEVVGAVRQPIAGSNGKPGGGSGELAVVGGSRRLAVSRR